MICKNNGYFNGHVTWLYVHLQFYCIYQLSHTINNRYPAISLKFRLFMKKVSDSNHQTAYKKVWIKAKNLGLLKDVNLYLLKSVKLCIVRHWLYHYCATSQLQICNQGEEGIHQEGTGLTVCWASVECLSSSSSCRVRLAASVRYNMVWRLRYGWCGSK